jgi:hypothetical protein
LNKLNVINDDVVYFSSSHWRLQLLFNSDDIVPKKMKLHRNGEMKSEGAAKFGCLGYVKFKRAERISRTTPPLSGPTSPLRLPLQFGWDREIKVTDN